MKCLLALACAFLALAGCKPTASTDATAPSTTPVASQPASGSGGVTPVGPNVGAMTPVTGGENLGGGSGGGVGQMAKNQARRAASQAGAATGTDDGQ